MIDKEKMIRFKRVIPALLLPVIFIGILWSASSVEDTEYLSLDYALKINAQNLSEHVEVLASDSLEGRETGTEGDLKAAYYLAQKMLEGNLESPYEAFMQTYDIVLPDKPDVTISTDFETYTLGRDFFSLFPHDSIEFHADEIIYVGYGIDDPKWNDYFYRDVRGKVVLVKAGEPRDQFGNSILTGLLYKSEWAADPVHAYILKRNAALKYGARAMLYYDPENFLLFKEIFDKIYKSKKQVHNIQVDSLYDFIIGQKMVQDISGYDKLDSVYYENRHDRHWKVPLEIRYNTHDDILSSQNVVAYIEGAENPDKYVLVCANFDHLGMAGGKIFHGANNNATGTSAVLEMARIFQEAADDGYPPKNSILFVLFSGREKNHIGAKYFMKHPPYPLTKTIGVVDVGMIGYVDTLSRDPNDIYIALDDSFKELIKDLNPLNKNKKGPQLTVNLVNPQKKFSNQAKATDGVVFYKKKFPVISFFNWLYPFNRKPDDTPDKISWDVYRARTQYIFLTVWNMANQ